MLHERIMEQLASITAEEQAYLSGRTTIDRELYMEDTGDVINSRKLLSDGKLITIRPHTRFVPFPEHSHDFVEVVYVCSGTVTHTINGKTIRLKAGELLFLSQCVTHSVQKSEETDLAVNLIVLPEFFAASLSELGEEETPLRRFLVDCLCGRNTGSGYLHFQVSDVPVVQNLVENLLWTILQETPNKRRVCQMTMTLLFMQLIGHTETLVTESQEEAAVLKVLQYAETNYVRGSLTEAARLLHYDLSWLSREIKRKTGKTYTQIVQEKRLAQAAFLLKNTDRNVADISVAVGYENISYFHRIFAAAYGISPKHYRDQAQLQERTLF